MLQNIHLKDFVCTPHYFIFVIFISLIIGFIASLMMSRAFNKKSVLNAIIYSGGLMLSTPLVGSSMVAGYSLTYRLLSLIPGMDKIFSVIEGPINTGFAIGFGIAIMLLVTYYIAIIAQNFLFKNCSLNYVWICTFFVILFNGIISVLPIFFCRW